MSKVGCVCRIPTDTPGPPLGCFKCGKQAKVEVLTEMHTHYQMRRLCETDSYSLVRKGYLAVYDADQPSAFALLLEDYGETFRF